MTRDDIIRMAREAGAMFDHMTWVERDLAPVFERFAALVISHHVQETRVKPTASEREMLQQIAYQHGGIGDLSQTEFEFGALVAAEVHKTYNPIGTVAGGATERTFMHPSVKYVLPTGLQLYARIEVREEDKV